MYCICISMVRHTVDSTHLDIPDVRALHFEVVCAHANDDPSSSLTQFTRIYHCLGQYRYL